MKDKKPVTVIAMEDRAPLTGGERYIAEIVRHYREQNRLFRVLRMKDFEPIKKTRIISINKKIVENLSDIPQGSIVLIDFYYHPWVLWGAYKLKRQKGCSIVVLTQWFDFDFIESYLKRNVQKALARLLLKISDVVVVNSDYFGRVTAKFGADMQKQIVISPGIDIDRFISARQGSKEHKKESVKIIVIGNIQPRKGIDDILYAAKMLNTKEKFEIHIFGDKEKFTPYMTTLMELLKRLQVEEKVCFRGSVFGDKLLAELEDADIFLQASHFEGYGISLVEGMLAGLPPVTTNTGIAEELIQHGQNGFLVPIKNPPAIAKALNILLNNEKLRKEMGIKARETAIRHALTWEEVGNMFESAVDSLLIEK